MYLILHSLELLELRSRTEICKEVRKKRGNLERKKERERKKGRK